MERHWDHQNQQASSDHHPASAVWYTVPSTVTPTFSFAELIQHVTVNTEPEYAVEEESLSFTLHYSTGQGVPEQWTWYFNTKEIKDSSHYSVKQKSLVISQPNRNDTGQYRLDLRNPYSNVTTYKNVTVLCKTLHTCLF